MVPDQSGLDLIDFQTNLDRLPYGCMGHWELPVLNNLIMVSREVLINLNVIDLWSCSDLVDGASRKSAGIAFKNMAVVNTTHLLKTPID